MTYSYRLLASYSVSGQAVDQDKSVTTPHDLRAFSPNLHISRYSESTNASNRSADGIEFFINYHTPVHISDSDVRSSYIELHDIFTDNCTRTSQIVLNDSPRPDHSHTTGTLATTLHTAANRHWVSFTATPENTLEWCVELSPAQTRHLTQILLHLKDQPITSEETRAWTFDKVHANGTTTTIDSEIMDR